MDIKFFEIRDRSTFIPVIATLIAARNINERYLLRRTGFTDAPGDYVILTRLGDMQSNWDVYGWNHPRTMPTAHQYILGKWNELTSGDVIDVEFILGESETKKISERLESFEYHEILNVIA